MVVVKMTLGGPLNNCISLYTNRFNIECNSNNTFINIRKAYNIFIKINNINMHHNPTYYMLRG